MLTALVPFFLANLTGYPLTRFLYIFLAGTAGLVFDPVDALLAGGSGGQSVAFFVACLGVAAIGTTFIGMYLTFAQVRLRRVSKHTGFTNLCFESQVP